LTEIEHGVIIDGLAIARKLRGKLRKQIEAMAAEGVVPSLDVILVGDDEASQVYVQNKEKICQRLGVRSRTHLLPASVSQSQLERKIAEVSDDSTVDGILLQLPLPKGLDANKAVSLIDPVRDVDGLHAINTGRMFSGHPGLRPCTPMGCIALLDEISCDPSGKRAVVIGRSNLIGRPIAFMLLQRNATVTICHSHTVDLANEVRSGDIVIAAVGQPEIIRGDWLKKGAVVIDVGINRLPDGKLVGDVAFAEALPQVSAITPVPGGVGPMTITMLLYNTVEAARTRRQIQ
jgi:methylenetetrahydrofolate dehydrogenase (NADP+)/methenyltetrahydrofolate cyclohydrolase